ncbi:MAG TPA: hypothetical protein VFE47_12345 [Tepidisphaeraceae bacterium]|nr:hypothetical protein [Tepidisphaeraceae bacterium]
MPKSIDIRELPARLEEILALAAAGGEIILVDGAVPRARLMPIEGTPQRIAGLHPGALAPAPDFDSPLPDDFWTGQK